jgi:uncharacterized protein DUF5667
VTFDFLDRRSAERFAELLDETTAGHRHHSRGPGDDQFAELVAIGGSLSAAKPGVRVDPEFRVGLRAMLIATAERDGLGRTSSAVEPETTAPAAPGRTGLRAGLFGSGGRRIRTRGAIVIGVAAGAMAVSGISAASENASPGSALYGVKRSTERAQLAIAGSDATRGQLSLDFARTRLAEAAAMPGGGPEFARVLDDMDVSTRKGVRLLNTSAVSRRDTKPLTTIDGFVAGQRQTLTPVLGKLTETGRQRAMISLALLEDVHQRADDLRIGLNCAPVVSAGSDLLGPKLKDCATGASSAVTPGRASGHSGKSSAKPTKEPKVRPERSGPTVAPKASVGTSRRPAAPNASASAAVGTYVAPQDGATPAPSATVDGVYPDEVNPPDDVYPEPDDRGFNLLGGILGNN